VLAAFIWNVVGFLVVWALIVALESMSMMFDRRRPSMLSLVLWTGIALAVLYVFFRLVG